jgi:hypothetical protein
MIIKNEGTGTIYFGDGTKVTTRINPGESVNIPDNIKLEAVVEPEEMKILNKQYEELIKEADLPCLSKLMSHYDAANFLLIKRLDRQNELMEELKIDELKTILDNNGYKYEYAIYSSEIIFKIYYLEILNDLLEFIH